MGETSVDRVRGETCQRKGDSQRTGANSHAESRVAELVGASGLGEPRAQRL